MKILRQVKILLALLLISAFLAACSRSAPKPSPTPQPTGTSVVETFTATVSATEQPVSATPPPVITHTLTQRPQVDGTKTPGEVTGTPRPQASSQAPTPRPSQTPRPSTNYVFPTDESGFPLYPTDEEGNEYFPTDAAGNPIIATDESGFPIFPIDIEGNFIIPQNPQGTPLYATDEFGFPIVEITDESFFEDLPTDEEFPTDEFFEETLEPDITEEVEDIPTMRPGDTIRPTSTRRPTSEEVEATAGPSGLLARTPIIWATPVTNQPLGSEENPLYMGLVVTREDDLVRADAMDVLAQRLSDDTGLVIRARRTGSYAELLNGMRAGGIHMAWLQPFTYIVAHQRGYADVVLVSNHFGLDAYGTMFLANANSGITNFFNENTNSSTADAPEALAQFADLKPCWVDPMSASGYIAPAGLLAENNISVKEPIFLMSHAGVVRALYIQGICDFGATFALSGDPRTAASLQQSLPDVMDKVKVVWQSDAIIPSLNLSVAPRLSEDLRVKVIEALIDLVQNDAGKAMLTDANAYDIRGLKEVDDSFYQRLRDLLNKSGVNSRTLLGK